MTEPVARLLRTLDPGPADAELLRRYAEARDQAAFELLVWRHAGMVQAAARSVLKDRHLAEDAAQATFLALAKHAGRVRANPAGWLYRTARRAALGVRRAGGVSPPVQPRPERGSLPPAAPGGLHPPLASDIDADDLTALHDELARLPDRYRLPVLLCLVEGLTHPAAAARLGWPVGTVAGRLSRAKALLRDRLTRRGVTAGLTVLAAESLGANWVSATAAAATAFAAGSIPGVSPSTLLVAKGLVRAMTVTRLQWAAGVLVAGLAVGGVWAVGPGPGGNPPVARPPAPPAERVASEADWQRSRVALRRLTRAMNAYATAHGRYPADLADAAGRPLLSWRVAVLPQLGEDALYRRFRPNEPWDSPVNRPLLAAMPDVYRLAFQPADATATYFQRFTGPGTLFPPGRPLDRPDTPKGWMGPMLVAEVGPAVPWTHPADVAYDWDRPLPAVTWPFANQFHLGTANEEGQTYTLDFPERELRRIIEPAPRRLRDTGRITVERAEPPAK